MPVTPKVEFEFVPKANKEAMDKIKEEMNKATDVQTFQKLAKQLQQERQKVTSSNNPTSQPGKMAGIRQGLQAAYSGSDGGGGGTEALAAAGPYGAAAAAIIKGASMAADAIKKIWSETLRTVGTANPAAMERWQQVLEDIDGVIGHSLTPILEAATQVMRAVGDALASILPSGAQVQAAMHNFQPALEKFREVLAACAPALEYVGVLLLKLLERWMSGIERILTWLQNTINYFLVKLGYGALEFSKLKLSHSSVGAAAKSAAYTNTEELGRSLYLSAAQKGGQDPAALTAMNTSLMVEHLRKMAENTPPNTNPGMAQPGG